VAVREPSLQYPSFHRKSSKYPAYKNVDKQSFPTSKDAFASNKAFVVWKSGSIVFNDQENAFRAVQLRLESGEAVFSPLLPTTRGATEQARRNTPTCPWPPLDQLSHI
jgi:hypothetical protein